MRIPRTIQDIASEVGLETAVRLTAMTQGRHRQAYIPASDVPDNHPLVKAVGRDGATALQRAFGGEHVNVPTPQGLQRRRRASARAGAILRGLHDGKTSAEMQAEHGVSQQYVSRLRAKGRTSSRWRKPREYRRARALMNRNGDGMDV